MYRQWCKTGRWPMSFWIASMVSTIQKKMGWFSSGTLTAKPSFNGSHPPNPRYQIFIVISDTKIQMQRESRVVFHTGVKSHFLSINSFEFDYWINVDFWTTRFRKCDFCEKWASEMRFLWKNVILKMWILLQMRFWKCEFCYKCNFENVNFDTNEILKIWISWNM